MTRCTKLIVSTSSFVDQSEPDLRTDGADVFGCKLQRGLAVTDKLDMDRGQQLGVEQCAVFAAQ